MDQSSPLRDRFASLPPRPHGITAFILWIGLSPLAVLCFWWSWYFPKFPALMTTGQASQFELAWGRGALISSLYESGQWWRLWSAPLAHASTEHLSANLLCLCLTLMIGWRFLEWKGLKKGFISAIFVYSCAVFCFLLRATFIEGWSIGLSGGVLAFMGFVSLELIKKRSIVQWLWIPICLLYLGAGGTEVDHFTHFLGLSMGMSWSMLRKQVKSFDQSIHAIVKKQMGSALILFHFIWIGMAWHKLSDPDQIWSNWKIYPYIAELDGPGFGNGLCYVGFISQRRAQTHPWILSKMYPSDFLKSQQALLIQGISEQTSVALLADSNTQSIDHQNRSLIGLVCLTPLHLWPVTQHRQRWLHNAFDQLDLKLIEHRVNPDE